MNNQTESTNKEIRGNYCTLEDGTFVPEGTQSCIGDVRHVCRDGEWKSMGEFCMSDNSSDN